MKTRIMALSLLLLAGAGGAALAQERERDREPRGHVGVGGDRPQRPAARGAPQRPATPPRPPEAAEAPQAPRAPQAAGSERRRGGEARGGEGRRRGGDGQGRPVGRGVWVDRDGDADVSGLTGFDRQDHEDRTELRDARRFDGHDRDGRRDRDGDGRRDRDGRRDGDVRRDGDGRWTGDRDGRRDGDRRWDGDRGGRRPPPNHPRWDRRHYPPVYSSRHRYRGHVWRPPSGFYVRLWSYGDVLPRGWYDEGYRLWSWWDYGLPMPPPGYDWVRVGYDAILVDRFTGRVVQVVRLVFW